MAVKGPGSAAVVSGVNPGPLLQLWGAFLSTPPQNCIWPLCGSFCCHDAGNTGTEKGPTWLQHDNCKTSFPLPQVSKEVPGPETVCSGVGAGGLT